MCDTALLRDLLHSKKQIITITKKCNAADPLTRNMGSIVCRAIRFLDIPLLVYAHQRMLEHSRLDIYSDDYNKV